MILAFAINFIFRHRRQRRFVFEQNLPSKIHSSRVFFPAKQKYFLFFFAATRILMRSVSFYFHSKLASRLNLLLTEAFSEDPDLSEVPLCRIKAGMNHRLIESF